MKKDIIKKMGFCVTLLLGGVSGYALLQHIAKQNAPEFQKTQVVINGEKISVQQFYRHLSYGEQGWIYTTSEGHQLSVDSLCDYRSAEKRKAQDIKKIKLKKKVDTIYVSLQKNILNAQNAGKKIYQDANMDTLPRFPNLGEYRYDMITIREFKANNSELQKEIDIYNDRYNATSIHEYGHFINTQAGMRSWNSYPLKFIEGCLDEISVSIRQCLQQRKNYIQNNYNLDYITNRFNIYREAVKTGKFKPRTQENITEEERDFIANSVFDSWMKLRFKMYVPSIMARIKYYQKDAPYMAITENKAKHNAVIKNFFTIEGYDFWKYISNRESEILAQITPEMKKEWMQLKQEKFKNMSHFEKLEYEKTTQGEKSYNQILGRNKVLSSIISTFGKSK